MVVNFLRRVPIIGNILNMPGISLVSIQLMYSYNVQYIQINYIIVLFVETPRKFITASSLLVNLLLQ